MTRPRMGSLLRFTLLLVGVTTALAEAPRGQADGSPPRWKWQPGESLRYEFHQRNLVKPLPDGQGAISIMDVSVRFEWSVAALAEDGAAELVQRIESARVSMESGPFKASYDSLKAGEVEPSGRAFSAVFGPALAEPTRLKVDPMGRVLEIKVPEAVARASASSPFAGMSDSGSPISEPGLKNLTGLLAPTLPETLMSVGEFRERSVDLPADPARLSLRLRDRLKSIDEGTMTFDVQGTLAAPHGAPAGFALKVKESSVVGEIVFDRSAGRLSRSTLKQTARIGLAIDGKESEQSVEIESSLIKRARDKPEGAAK